MKLEFLSGTALQQSACRTAAENLLNLPPGSMPITHRVEFTADPLPSTHNEFAITEFEYDSLHATTKIASVAPNWPYPWEGVKFLQETYAHELGHALFAALPHSYRLQIAALFGADTDSLAVLQPEAPWEDRIIEGIAETFKAAFLPARFRRYPDRTKKNIPLDQYPVFRRIFREGLTSITGTGKKAKPVPEQIDEFSEPDDFNPSVNPLESPWELWKPASNIGEALSPAYAPQNLSISAALRGDSFQSSDSFGVTMSTKTILTGELAKHGACGVLMCADNEGGGNGYLLRVEWESPNSEPELWRFTLQYWRKGAVKSVLIDLKGVVYKTTTDFPKVALTLIKGTLTVWLQRSGEWEELASVKVPETETEHGPEQGYPGVFIEPAGTVSAAHAPRLNEFALGPIDLSEEEAITVEPVEIPPGSVAPGGARGGVVPKKLRVLGGRT